MKTFAIYYVGDKMFKEEITDHNFFGGVFKEAKAYAQATGLKLYRALVKIELSELDRGIMSRTDASIDWTPVVDMA